MTCALILSSDVASVDVSHIVPIRYTNSQVVVEGGCDVVALSVAGGDVVALAGDDVASGDGDVVAGRVVRGAATSSKVEIHVPFLIM